MIKQAKDRPYLNDRLPAKADIVLMIPKRVTLMPPFRYEIVLIVNKLRAINGLIINGLIIVIDNIDFQSAGRHGNNLPKYNIYIVWTA